MEKALFRLRTNAAPKKKKTKKDKGGFGSAGGGTAAAAAAAAAAAGDGDPSTPTVALFAEPSPRPIDPSTPNLAAWAAASLLVVGGERFAVRINPPSVAGLAALPSSAPAAAAAGGGNGTAPAAALANCRPPMVGYPLLPVHELRFADADCCSWRWLRRKVAVDGGEAAGKGSGSSSGNGGGGGGGGNGSGDPQQQQQQQPWEETGASGACYTPTEADLGCLLRVECVPARRHAGAAARAARRAAGLGPFAVAVPAADGEGAPGDGGGGGASAAIEHGEPGYAETTSAVAPGPALPAHVLRALAPAAASGGGGHATTTTTTTFRVMSYNLLANQYASNAYARTVLFSYCPPPFLAAEYRRQLALAEVAAHGPDVAMLQEVDASAFSDYFLPHLRRMGYDGRYTNKLGRVREGSATFWRRARFRLGGGRDVDLRRAFDGVGAGEGDGGDGGGGGGALHGHFAALVRASPALAEALQKVTTIAQVTLLLPADEGGGGGGGGGGEEGGGGGGGGGGASGGAAPLLVANTHLFFHPYAPHIRTMHTAAILEEAAEALRDWEAGVPGRGQRSEGEEEDGEDDEGARDGGAAASSLAAELARRPRAALLFGGDLNSDLNDGVPGVVELLQAGGLSRDHWDWRCGASFRWGKGEDEYGDATGGATAAGAGAGEEQDGEAAAAAAAAAAAPAPTAPSSSADLPPVIGVDVRNVPFLPLRSADGLRTPYTNFTSGYKALLDYVWHDPARLVVRRALPAPPEALLRGFIPSEAFPSDHLAVVFDFDWAVAAEEEEEQEEQEGGGSGSGAPLPFVALPVAAAGAVAAAAARLARGGAIALPTDTLYGLAADARSAGAVAALAAAKGRDAGAKPLAVAVADVADVARVAETGGLPEGLLAALLPGPVTVLLRPAGRGGGGGGGGGGDDRGQQQGEGGLALGALGARDKIGVRVPQCEFTRAVIRALAAAAQGAGGGATPAALALTSANASGCPSPLRADDTRALWPRLAGVFDGGPVAAASAAGSTVVDLSVPGEARIVRRGVAAANVARLLAQFGPSLLRVVATDG